MTPFVGESLCIEPYRAVYDWIRIRFQRTLALYVYYNIIIIIARARILDNGQFYQHHVPG